MNAEKSLQSHPRVPAGILHQRIKDHYVVLHPQYPVWTIVNEMGWSILQLLTGDNSVEDVVQLLLARYEVDSETLTGDVQAFIASFVRSGLIATEDAAAAVAPDVFSSVFLHITSKCNLHCKHCYYQAGAAAPLADLDDAVILSFLEAFVLAGGTQISLSGGETFLRLELVKEILERWPQARFTILTNGTLIDDALAAYLADKNVHLQISIDGSTAEIHDGIRGPGSFQAALAGIAVLLRHGFSQRLNICTTVMKQNFDDAHNIISLARRIGVKMVRFIPLLKEGRACTTWQDIKNDVSEKQFEVFYTYIFDQAKQDYPDMQISSGLCGLTLDRRSFDQRGHWCPIARTLIVDSGGDVYSCAMLMKKEFCLGNICDNSIEQLCASPVRLMLISALTQRKQKNENCRQCIWQNFCQAGCMGLALHSGGSIHVRDELCSFRKKLYEKAIVKLVEGKKPLYFTGERSECT
ncbi:PqqD family peptide modification chaperone [Thermodesulfobacteriota bacterium]